MFHLEIKTLLPGKLLSMPSLSGSGWMSPSSFTLSTGASKLLHPHPAQHWRLWHSQLLEQSSNYVQQRFWSSWTRCCCSGHLNSYHAATPLLHLMIDKTGIECSLAAVGVWEWEVVWQLKLPLYWLTRSCL